MSRKFLPLFTGALALLSGTANAVFIIIFLVNLVLLHNAIAGLAITAAVSQVISLVGLVLTLNRQWEGRFSWIDILGVIFSLIAGIASTTAIVLAKFHVLPEMNKQSDVTPKEKSVLRNGSWGLLLPALAISVVFLLAQATFYLTILSHRPYSRADVLPESLPPMQGAEEAYPSKGPQTATATLSNPPKSQLSTISPTSTLVSDTASSLRSSLSIAIRPSNSRTKLVSRQKSFPRDSSSQHSSFDTSARSRPSQDSYGFDTWDTSSVPEQLRETILRSSPVTREPNLSPIPGSRSPSPAKALEGPFFFPSPSPPASPAKKSPGPNFSRPSSARQRSFSNEDYFSRRRSRSAPGNEDHIHPLFRTNSPSPAPGATPGTIVTAAPIAGHMINERTLRRMRSGSLPSSPSPLGMKRAESLGPANGTGRRPSPPSRETTPPIPDFVLGAGTRTSWVVYGKRKDGESEHEGELDGFNAWKIAA
ncbi:hypothetical protein MMC20_004788 [Loxospora ochrophaea]|nr:hypothetical protein [Loxospora ochrophaea]